jgi:hypothetical protein
MLVFPTRFGSVLHWILIWYPTTYLNSNTNCQGFPHLSQVWSLARMVDRSQRDIHWHLVVYYKSIPDERKQSDEKDAYMARFRGRSTELLCPLQGAPSTFTHMFTNWKFSSSVLLGFYRTFIMCTWLAKSMPNENQLNLCSRLPTGEGRRFESANPLIACLVTLATSPHPI